MPITCRFVFVRLRRTSITHLCTHALGTGNPLCLLRPLTGAGLCRCLSLLGCRRTSGTRGATARHGQRISPSAPTARTLRKGRKTHQLQSSVGFLMGRATILPHAHHSGHNDHDYHDYHDDQCNMVCVPESCGGANKTGFTPHSPQPCVCTNLDIYDKGTSGGRATRTGWVSTPPPRTPQPPAPPPAATATPMSMAVQRVYIQPTPQPATPSSPIKSTPHRMGRTSVGVACKVRTSGVIEPTLQDEGRIVPTGSRRGVRRSPFAPSVQACSRLTRVVPAACFEAG